MKNLSLIINGILAIAVVVLFYQVYSLKANGEISQTQTPILQANTIVNANNTNLADAKIAYINTDSINEHYAYIADFTKTLRAKKVSLEAQMESMTAKFQNDYQALQQSAQAGIAPQADLQKQEEALKRQQSELANKELQMQNLGLELEEKNLELNRNVKQYLLKFNNGKFDYILSYSDLMPTVLLVNPKLDITPQILQGLNEDYNAKKKK